MVCNYALICHLHKLDSLCIFGVNCYTMTSHEGKITNFPLPVIWVMYQADQVISFTVARLIFALVTVVEG